MDLYDEAKRSTLLTYHNFPAYNSLNATVSWMGDIFSSYYTIRASGSYSQTWSQSPYLDGYVRYNQPMFSGWLEHHIIFDRDWRYALVIKGGYTTASDYLTGHSSDSWSLHAFLKLSPLKSRKLLIMIMGNNLLYNNSKETSKYKRIYSRNTNYMYNRTVTIGLTYRFNNFKDTFNKNNSNARAIQRAE